MEFTEVTPAPCQNEGKVPCNPPPQRRAISRSVSGTIAADPSHTTLSPLLTGGARRAVCVPCLIIASF
jgi:hypothetical protein